MLDLSVIIPTYNRPEQTAKALQSVFLQTQLPREVLISDDGSDVPVTPEQLGVTVPEGVALHILREERNHGVSHARNIAIERASSTWIALLDSDDIWHHNKLEKQMKWLSEHPNFRIIQSEEIWIREGVRVNPPKTHHKREGDIFHLCLKRCMITPSSVVMHRTLFEEYGLFNEDFPTCEDYDLWLKISAKEQIGLVPELLMTRYGGHEDQLSGTVPVQDRFRVASIISLLDSGTLTAEQQEKAVATAHKKLRILSQGAAKRGKTEDAENYKKQLLTLEKNYL